MRTPNFHGLTPQLPSHTPLLLVLRFATPLSFPPKRQVQVLPPAPRTFARAVCSARSIVSLKCRQGFCFLATRLGAHVPLTKMPSDFPRQQDPSPHAHPIIFRAAHFSSLLVCLRGVVSCTACVFLHQNILCEGSYQYLVSFLHPIAPTFSTPGILHNN